MYPQPALSDGVITVRPWSTSDVDCVRQAGQDPYIPTITTVPAVYDLAAGQAFILRQLERLKSGEGISLAVVDCAQNVAVGAAYLAVRPQAGVMGLGYWIVPKARRRGLSTRAVGLVTEWALSLDVIARVEAWVEADNHASQRTLIAAGFLREGVLRSFLAIADRRANAIVFSRTVTDVQTKA